MYSYNNYSILIITNLSLVGICACYYLHNNNERTILINDRDTLLRECENPYLNYVLNRE